MILYIIHNYPDAHSFLGKQFCDFFIRKSFLFPQSFSYIKTLGHVFLIINKYSLKEENFSSLLPDLFLRSLFY